MSNLGEKLKFGAIDVTCVLIRSMFFLFKGVFNIVRLPVDILFNVCTPLMIRFSRSGNITMLKLLLKLGFNPNKCYLGSTPLIAAIRSDMDSNKKVQIVKYLLDNGADVNLVTEEKTSFFKKCLRCVIFEPIRILLEEHLGFVHTIKEERTPLFTACLEGSNLELIRILVEYGANVNFGAYYLKVDPKGVFSVVDSGTALTLACRNLQTDVVRFLIDNGANSNVDERIYPSGMQPMYVLLDTYNDVLQKNRYFIVAHALNEFGVDSRAVPGVIRFFRRLGLEMIDWERGKATPQSNVRVVVTDFEELSYIYDNTEEKQAARLDIARILIESGITKIDDDFRDVFGSACGVDNPDLDMLRLLANYCTDIDSVTINDEGLRSACYSERPNLDVIEFFVKRGANVNANVSRGESFLKYNCRRKLYDVAKYLLCNGATFEYDDIPGLFGKMTQLEPKILCAIHSRNVSELNELIKAYNKEINANRCVIGTQINACDFSDILKKHILPKVRAMRDDLHEEMLSQDGLDEYSIDKDRVDTMKMNLNNLDIIEKQIKDLADVTKARLNEDIISLINGIGIERVGANTKKMKIISIGK